MAEIYFKSNREKVIFPKSSFDYPPKLYGIGDKSQPNKVTVLYDGAKNERRHAYKPRGTKYEPQDRK